MSPWALFGAAAVSALLTGLLRQYALVRGVLDVPNDRSSHAVPTPRGGGVAIALTFLGGLSMLAVLRRVDATVAAALIGSGLVAAGAGFLDDHRSIAARWRLLMHFAAATWALAWLGGLPPVALAGTTVGLGWIGDVLAVVYLVWLLNLYNFMDGIDGLAGLEAVTVALGAAVLVVTRSAEDQQWVLPALLAAATVGFLIWNWPPARIFVGDAGSGFLGLTLGVLSIHAARSEPPLLWSWIILLGVFIVDATLTLLRRLHRGEAVYLAHRSHAYQHAAQLVGAHRPVTLMVGAINVCWLLPMALLVAAGRLDGLAGIVIAYAPLTWLGIRYRAGAARLASEP